MQRWKLIEFTQKESDGDLINQLTNKMFYLLKKTIDEIHEGDVVMLLADFSGLHAGMKGTISENYKRGVMVQWDSTHSDGFGADELEYLAFETAKHPFKT